MPYSGPDDQKIPDHIKAMDEAMRRRWVGAYNSAHDDCMEEGGDDCEGMAMRVANAAVSGGELTAEQFLFVELEGVVPTGPTVDGVLVDGKPFVGFVTGTFVDMYGREVSFEEKDIAAYLANTRATIAQFQERGRPGLPVDEKNHDKGDAAGWIVGVEETAVTDSAGKVRKALNILTKWTSLGVKKIREKIQTSFSPTVSRNKTIVGGSLTNWAATVDEAGIPLVGAIELSQGIHYLKVFEKGGGDAPNNKEHLVMADKDAVKTPATPDKGKQGAPPEMVELTQSQIDELVDARLNARLEALELQRGKQAQPDYAELAKAFGLNTEEAKKQQIESMQQLAEMVRQQANLQWQHELANMQRASRYTELSHRVTGGSPEAPRGIPVGADEIKEHLMKLPEDEAKFWAGVLETTVKHGLTDFSEVGHGKKLEGTVDLGQFAPMLETALASGMTIEEFFEVNPELGDMGRYDLAKYKGAK